MKKILILLFCVLCLNLDAKPRCKKKLRETQILLQLCIEQKLQQDSCYVSTEILPRKKARWDAKVEIVKAKQETKQIKSNNKTEIKTDKFLNFIQGLTRITASLVVGGFISSGMLLMKGLQLLKKTSWFSWLPV